jgi:hypothetical protein
MLRVQRAPRMTNSLVTGCLLLVRPARKHLSTSLQYTLQILVHGECDSLAWSYTHNAWCDAFVETLNTLLFPQVAATSVSHCSYTASETSNLPRNDCYPLDRTLALFSRRLLQPRLDRINRRICERPNSPGYQPNQTGLIAR